MCVCEREKKFDVEGNGDGGILSCGMGSREVLPPPHPAIMTSLLVSNYLVKYITFFLGVKYYL